MKKPNFGIHLEELKKNYFLHLIFIILQKK